MPTPASPARALHNILTTVNGASSSPHAYEGWGSTAGAAVTSTDFAVFHTEAAALLSEVVESIRALPVGPQLRYFKYVPSWWDALVHARHDWAALKTISNASDLDHLESLADLVEQANGPDNPRTPSMLRDAITFLLDKIERADDDLPEPVRNSIVADLNHVLWLLENVATYGVDHAVAAAERVAGKTVVAATKSRSKTLQAVAAGLVAVLGFVGVATGQVDEIATNVKHTFSITSEAPAQSNDKDPVQVTVNQIVEMCKPPVPPKEIGPGQSARQSVDDDVVDAEVVGGDE